MIRLGVTFPPPGDNILAQLAQVDQSIPKAIKRGMDFGMQLVIGRIQLDQLSGIGPYPPSEHRLGTRSEQLRNALHATPAVIRGNTVTVEIVNMVRYAGVHEYGMTIYPKTKKFLAFQIDNVWIRAKKVKIPERMPVRYGFTKNRETLSEAVKDEVNIAVDKLLK